MNDDQPRFLHACTECEFVGRFDVALGGIAARYDGYVCGQSGAYLLRYGHASYEELVLGELDATDGSAAGRAFAALVAAHEGRQVA